MRWIFFVALLISPLSLAQDSITKLPSIPDREGLAGCFAGVSHQTLLVCGGANFPNKKPWEGGNKVWSDAIYALETSNGTWQRIGKLPRPLGYGISVTYRNRVICVGGSDAAQHYQDVFQLEWSKGKLTITQLPPLPRPVANSCGALVDDRLYVVGGQATPNDTSTLRSAFVLDLSAEKPNWKTLPDCPGTGRMLSTASSHQGRLWIFGGVDLVMNSGKVERHYLGDAYQYDPSKGWKRIADMPNPLAAAPSPAPNSDRGIYLLGGDDGTHVRTPPDQHPGFSRVVFQYNSTNDKWHQIHKLNFSRVTVPVVYWNDSWVIISGEQRPGIRSPDVWAIKKLK